MVLQSKNELISIKMHPKKFIIEGLDRLGKTSLIEGIRNQLGYYEVIHYSKPVPLDYYRDNSNSMSYEYDSVRTMMRLLNSDANIICDRAHLGVSVYAPIYRGYSGDFVFDLEWDYKADHQRDCRLVLLTEDLSISKHFVDDGKALGGPEKRLEEQAAFIMAFSRSHFPDKRAVCVTDPVTGEFKDKAAILKEVLA